MPIGNKKKKEAPSETVDSKAAPTTLESGEPSLENWADKPDSLCYQEALKLYPLIQKAYDNKEEQADRIEEFWNIFNCTIDENQQYTGNQQAYIPAVRDAVNARTKRVITILFPANNKHVDGVSSDGEVPHTVLSLLEYYIRILKLRSTLRTTLIAGDVTGQWNLHLDWFKTYRRIQRLLTHNAPILEIDGENVQGLDLVDPTMDEEELESEDILEEGPIVEDFATEDLVVIPPTISDIQKCHCCALRLRMSPDAMNMMVDEGVFILPDGTDAHTFCLPENMKDKKPPPKEATKGAGIKLAGTNPHALIYYTYAKLNFGTEKEPDKRLGIVYFIGRDQIIGLIKAPYWNGKIPILSAPVDKRLGSFFGVSKIEPVKFLQWQATDFMSMGQDSAMYSLLPTYGVNTMLVPQWFNLTHGLAAMWPAVGPIDQAFKELPKQQIWKEAMTMVDALKRQIWESMDVNEMMMGKMPAGRKNNALMGQMQQEQQTNILDHARRFEDEIMNPLVEWLFELDQQFRTAELMIEQRGEIGVKAKVDSVPVQQWGAKYFFRWLGSEAQQNAQRLQSQISWANVVKGIPPQMMPGKQLDLSPMIEMGTEQIFGPELAPRIIKDTRNQFTLDPEMENEIIFNKFEVLVHEADDDAHHLQSHMMAANKTQDPDGRYKEHMKMHMAAMQKKREMAMAQQQQKGAPGMPGGGGAPGVPGTPKPGAQPMPPRGGQQPPGAVNLDAMLGAAGRG